MSAFAGRIAAFYQKYAPEKLERQDYASTVADEYHGREHELNHKLRSLYAADLDGNEGERADEESGAEDEDEDDELSIERSSGFARGSNRLSNMDSSSEVVDSSEA